MLDFDPAELFELETRALKQPARRYVERFPADFMFGLTAEEWKAGSFSASKKAGA